MAFPRLCRTCLGAALAAGACLAGAAPQSAAGFDPATALTEEQLATRVVAANPGVAALRFAAAAAAHRIDAAGALDDPMLSYAAAPRTLGTDRFNQRVEFSQRIPWPGTLAARRAVARFEAAAARGDLEALQLEIAAQARSTHAQWRFVAEALAIHHETRALLDTLITTTETHYAAGRGSQQDVLQAAVERTELDRAELGLRRLQATVRARINALLNRPPEAFLPPAAPMDVLPPPTQDDIETVALARHPVLRRLDAQVAANESRVELAARGFYPDLQLGVGYNGLWDEPAKRPTLAVAISLPLDRSKRRAKLDAARADASAAQWALADRRAQLLADLAQARAEVVEARHSVQIYEAELLPLAGDYLDAALADYQSGTGAFGNVIAAEQRKLATGLALARARAELAARRAELDRAAGVPPNRPETDSTGARP